MSTKSYSVVEFYSGIGGLHLALKHSHVSGTSTVVRAFDWDQAACRVYTANHGPNICRQLDISTLQANDLSIPVADCWLLSPSCQPYTTLNPSAKGVADPRAKSFLHLVQNILPKLVSSKSHPRYLLVENVAGFETSSARQLLVSSLKSLGYVLLELLLTPLQFGIPNSRLRYYLLAKMTPLSFTCDTQSGEEDRVWRHIPGRGTDWVDPRFPMGLDQDHNVKEIRDYLDANIDSKQPHPHAVPDRVLEKWGRLFDIVLPSSRRTCCFTRGYTQLVERSGSILQMNESLDTEIVFKNFARAQEDGDPDAVRTLDPLRLRYFSPSELLRIFRLSTHLEISSKSGEIRKDFLWPEGISSKTKYKLIGNSVNVEVVTGLVDFLFESG